MIELHKLYRLLYVLIVKIMKEVISMEDVKQKSPTAADNQPSSKVKSKTTIEEPIIEETGKNAIADSAMEERADDTTPKKKGLTPKGKKIVLISIALLVIISAIAVPYYLNSTFFHRLASDVAKNCPGAHCYFGKDYFAIDTNPKDVDSSSMELMDIMVHKDSIEAIEYVNNKLGFPSWLYDDMLDTTALMGKQSESFGKYTVSWSYHPNKGLEVKYVRN